MQIKTSNLETTKLVPYQNQEHKQTLIWVLSKDDSNCSYAGEAIATCCYNYQQNHHRHLLLLMSIEFPGTRYTYPYLIKKTSSFHMLNLFLDGKTFFQTAGFHTQLF